MSEEWPVVRGDMKVGRKESRIAVVTLASDFAPFADAALSGPCKTENLGIEKIIANTISNPDIRYILICGSESRGHLPGNTLLALHKNGIDGNGRIVGSEGAIPFIENLQRDAIERFQKQVQLIDRIGTTDLGEIGNIVREYANKSERYPEEPMYVVEKKKKAAAASRKCVSGDILIGNDLVMDAGAGIIYAAQEA